MTAQEQMKKMLDELMGTQRDGATPDADLKFTSDRVCKSYLMGLCPHQLFNNTKMDLGSCQKIHNPALKADFEAASKTRDYGYNMDQMEHLQSFINDCDRKIAIAKKRLEDTQDEFDTSEEAKAIQDIGEQIGKKLAKAEELGAAGEVEESISLMNEVEELKIKKREAEEIYRSQLPTSSIQQQKLRVCEVCAAYLSLYDNDRRFVICCVNSTLTVLILDKILTLLADHFGGKLHMGFIKIRNRLQELNEEIARKREERELERQKRREEREREREQERREMDKRRSGDRDRRSSRDADRGRRRRSRSRSRDHKRRRSQSRSRDRRRRTRSRSPSHKSRSPSHKSRSSSRSRKSRSPSRSRKSRSTSRSRKSRSTSRSRKSRSTSRSREAKRSRSRSRSK
ncbi:putative RNA-binding protein Luc7-like 2 isoform X1 [Nematostella vectensis]|uniref:putative RNA-binding protein Luc7-like 2 isoform X1 n=2 Tax=Nematostella vectensis TaxID=45351 RepID=UPI00207723D9|nr:putative RNA-binding protein Luc7-like 2 isoform X1 [Nematostella vectensis]XP_048576296.1 putative RNA-binding protein Luc7-like 2 isoform X1 [Nematostella vectensis]XP_048576297.1 putative RNA-binding protein Luc7-like 2 isoform X1 [Nematostella vectensis]